MTSRSIGPLIAFGAEVQRDTVGCKHRSRAVGRAAAGELEAGVGAQMIEVVSILVAAGNGQHAGAQDIGDTVRDEQRIARICDQRRQALGKAQAWFGVGQQHDAASEVMRSPSNAAVTFLRPTAGNRNGTAKSSDMAGVARRNYVSGWLRHPIRKHDRQLTRHRQQIAAMPLNRLISKHARFAGAR